MLGFIKRLLGVKKKKPVAPQRAANVSPKRNPSAPVGYVPSKPVRLAQPRPVSREPVSRPPRAASVAAPTIARSDDSHDAMTLSLLTNPLSPIGPLYSGSTTSYDSAPTIDSHACSGHSSSFSGGYDSSPSSSYDCSSSGIDYGSSSSTDTSSW